MLNLKELEESLDNALAAETYESVMAWFQDRDKEKIKTYIGVQGYLQNLANIHDKSTISVNQKYLQKELEVSPSDFLTLAA